MRIIVGVGLIVALAVPAIAKEFVAQPTDFRCLTDGAQPDGKRFRMEELSLQRWRGDRISEERFFYDPEQRRRFT